MPRNFLSLSEPFESSDLPPKLRKIPEKEKMEHLSCAAAQANAAYHPEYSEDAFFASGSQKVLGVFDGLGGGALSDLLSNAASKELTRERMDEHLAKALPPKEREKMERLRIVLGTASDDPLERKDVEAALGDALVLMQRRLDEIAKSDVVQQGILKKFEKLYGRPYRPKDFQDAEKVERIINNMGTTATVVKCWKNAAGEANLTVGNVGDSRAYVLRDGVLYPLTRDHSWARLLMEEGILSNDQDVTQEIDLDAVDFAADRNIRFHNLAMQMREILRERARRKEPPQPITLADVRNTVLKVLSPGSHNPLEPDIQTYTLHAGDVVLLMSDGVHDNLTDEEMRELAVKHEKDPAALAKALKEKAYQRSQEGEDANPRSKPDDITVVVGRWDT